MPPKAVKTLGDLIFWQYAKIISDAAMGNRRTWGFVMDRYQALKRGEITWDWLREYRKEHEVSGECVYCGARKGVSLEHIIPRCKGGPDMERNAAWVCRECNSAKGGKFFYEWLTCRMGLKEAKYEAPRIAEGKYLKLSYEILLDRDMINASLDDFCPCDMQMHCSERKFEVLCLDGVMKRLLEQD